ncbi:cytosine deaminase [Anaerovibrio sp.]|uniref:cytosine deaminase n=1 Tax=Anaerovibrio sp. TaxID=1872532 RepID=UPI003F171BE9
MMKKKLYRNARLADSKEPQDLLVENGRFAAIGANLSADDAQVVDLGGRLVIAPYVDPHLHLDYVYTALGEGARNDSGTLFEGIQRWSETKAGATVDEIKARARRAVREEMLAGVQYIRTHVDVTDRKLTALKAILELREELRDVVTIQIVAFPQEGMYAYPGGAKLVEEALRMGADCVGGIPHFELAREFGEMSVHKAVELAVQYDKLIDVHCDETDDDQSRFLELLTALAIMEDIGERTTASHTCSFGSANNAYAFRMMSNFKRAGINFISCPTENIYLQGRQDSYPKRRGLTRVKEFFEAGINVCFAQDSISDPWYPLGNGNMMNILDHGIHICQMMSLEEIDRALELVTVNGARTMHLLDEYGIFPGRPASFLVLDAESPFEAIRNRAGVLRSVRNGKELLVRVPAAVTSSIEFLQ